MWDTIEEYGRDWIRVRKSPSFRLGKKLTKEECHRLEGVEDFLASWAMYKASKEFKDSLSNKKQLADIVMNRDASKVRG